MNFRVIYYHRLCFPSASGQTIAVVRDFYCLSEMVQKVDLFYRAPVPIGTQKLASQLKEFGATPTGTFHMRCIPEGWFGRKRFKKKVISIIREEKTPVVIVARSLSNALDAIRVGKSFSGTPVRVVMELHQDPFPHMNCERKKTPFRTWYIRKKEMAVFHGADAITCTAAAQLEILETMYPNHTKAWFLPNGYPGHYFNSDSRDSQKSNNGHFHLRYAGRLSEWKNPEVMINALTYLPERFVLEIAGGRQTDGKDSSGSLMETACRQKVENRVRFFGFIPPREVPSFLRQADCLLLPLGNNLEARLFTSPLKLFEYAASGIPMIVTRHPSTESLIEDGKHAILVPPGDPVGMARAIETVAENPVLAGNLAKNAKTWVTAFSLEKRLDRYKKHMETLF
jgi:glycosyltransferase involved in cell wall biosynthesis